MSMEPSTTSTNTRLIGQEGHEELGGVSRRAQGSGGEIHALRGEGVPPAEHAEGKVKSDEENQIGRTAADERVGLDAYAVKDFVKAAHFLRQAAGSGTCTNGQVFYELAEIYFDGSSVGQSDGLGLRYAQRAVDLGCTNALPMLRRLKNMQGVTAR